MYKLVSQAFVQAGKKISFLCYQLSRRSLNEVFASLCLPPPLFITHQLPTFELNDSIAAERLLCIS